jgi:hypothetical protein
MTGDIALNSEIFTVSEQAKTTADVNEISLPVEFFQYFSFDNIPATH